MRLLDTTVELLETESLDAVTMAMVLERSGISHGSLYHHFEDFPDLVEQAVVRRYVRRLQDSNQAIAALLDSSDADDFRRRAEELFVQSNDQARRHYRMDRVEVLGALRGRSRLQESIARAQQDITDELEGYYREFQQCGWMKSEIDAQALAVLTQALILGRVVDDVADRHLDPDQWTAIALRAFLAVAFPD